MRTRIRENRLLRLKLTKWAMGKCRLLFLRTQSKLNRNKQKNNLDGQLMNTGWLLLIERAYRIA